MEESNDIKRRKEAIAWWNGLPEIIKEGKTLVYFPGRQHKTLTGREVETLHLSRL